MLPMREEEPTVVVAEGGEERETENRMKSGKETSHATDALSVTPADGFVVVENIKKMTLEGRQECSPQ